MTTGWPQNQQDLRWPYSDADETGADGRAGGGVATDSERSDRSGAFGGLGTEHPSGPLPVTPAPSRGRLRRKSRDDKSRDASRGGSGPDAGADDADYDWIRYLGEAGPAQGHSPGHSQGLADDRPAPAPQRQPDGPSGGRGFSRRHAAPEQPAQSPATSFPAAQPPRTPASDSPGPAPLVSRRAPDTSGRAPATAGLGSAESATTSFPAPGRSGRRGRSAGFDEPVTPGRNAGERAGGRPPARADAPRGFSQPDAATSAWPASPSRPRPARHAPDQHQAGGYELGPALPGAAQPGGVRARTASPRPRTSAARRAAPRGQAGGTGAEPASRQRPPGRRRDAAGSSRWPGAGAPARVAASARPQERRVARGGGPRCR